MNQTGPPSSHDRQVNPDPSGEGDLTFVAPGATLEGRLRGDGMVVVQGTLRGAADIGGDLLVPAGGLLDGDPAVRADHIRVEGVARGRLEATRLFEAVPGSRIEAEVRAPLGRVSRGALARGARLRLGTGDRDSDVPGTKDRPPT